MTSIVEPYGYAKASRNTSFRGKRKGNFQDYPPGKRKLEIKTKKAKVTGKENPLKRKILSPCLFPHCRRIYDLFKTLTDANEKIHILNWKRQKSIHDELERNKSMIPMHVPDIELFYDSEGVLEVVEENTNPKDHHENCTVKKGSDETESKSSVTVILLSQRCDFNKDQINNYMAENKRPDFFTIRCQPPGSNQSRVDEKTYATQESGKCIRTVLSFIIEKPIRERLNDMQCRFETKLKRKLHEKYKVISTRPETRAMSLRETQIRSQGKDLRKLSKIDQFKMRFPEEFFKISEPFNYIIDRVVSLRNEVIREPGIPQNVQQGRFTKKISESVRSALSKREEVKIFGYIHGLFEIWIDECMISHGKSELENDLQNIVGEICRFRYVTYEAADTTIKPGDKLHKQKTEGSYGTMGTFAKSDRDIVGITIAHVLLGIENPLIKDKTEWRKIGEVIKPDEAMVENVGFVHINPSLRVELKIRKDDKLLESRLFDEDHNLADDKQIVYKKGAETEWTTGIVLLDKDGPNEQGMLIGNYKPGEKFAKKGDSGSAIIRFDPNDPDNERVEVISIFSGLYNEKATDTEVGHYTYRLRDPLMKLSNDRKTTYMLQ